MPTTLEANKTRFWAAITKIQDGCWLWQGPMARKGYGRFYFTKGKVLAHRAAWELTFGIIPEGLHVCHHCDTPLCVRPDHLFLGTRSDNMTDAYKKGRLPRPPLHKGNGIWTHCHRGHEFSPQNTRVCIDGRQTCLTCEKLRESWRPHRIRK